MAGVAVQLCHQMKSGHVVVVNSGAGPVANVIGQLAKEKGATVIAFCRSFEQAAWLRYLGFDHVFNQQNNNPSCAVGWIAPRGIDYYFDCTGASFTSAIIPNIKEKATICLFGYNTKPDSDLDPYHMIWMKGGRVWTDNLFNHKEEFENIHAHFISLIREGKLKYKEHVIRGFEKLPEALTNAYQSQAVAGKLVVAPVDTSMRTVLLEVLSDDTKLDQHLNSQNLSEKSLSATTNSNDNDVIADGV